MQKIPTLFVRDENDRRHVTNDVTPGCEWVLAGEGWATRKFDGTCVRVNGSDLEVRREVKAGGEVPWGFIATEHDETTGKTVGWEPADQSGFWKFFQEALGSSLWPNGTYELCGPKINRNPEGFTEHRLIPHGQETISIDVSSVEAIKRDVAALPHEGIVWHHPDGRMAKLKARDLT